MAEKIDPKKTAGFEEMPMSDTIEQEALMLPQFHLGSCKKTSVDATDYSHFYTVLSTLQF